MTSTTSKDHGFCLKVRTFLNQSFEKGKEDFSCFWMNLSRKFSKGISQIYLLTARILNLPLEYYIILFVGTGTLFIQFHLVGFYSKSCPVDPLPPTLKSISHEWAKNLTPLYIITPTYRRYEQIPEITRLSHTLMLVPNLTWLVIEDSELINPKVDTVLEKSGINYLYMAGYEKGKPKKPPHKNRNLALAWIRNNTNTGVIYFADDDNSYDLELFRELRKTKRVSMFPVGLVTPQTLLSSPIVINGSFAGFYDGYYPRKFAVDMAGFAVSVEFLLQRPEAHMPLNGGTQETYFLESLAPFEPREVELLARNCTKIFVWHTQTKENRPPNWALKKNYKDTNIELLYKLL